MLTTVQFLTEQQYFPTTKNSITSLILFCNYSIQKNEYFYCEKIRTIIKFGTDGF